MKRKLLAICLTIIFCIGVLAGCGQTFLQGGPAQALPISGNGSFAVTKGDYLYFVNGYISDDTIESLSYIEDGIYNGGLYRATLTDGNLTYDEDGKLTNVVELLSNKIVGFGDAGLFVFGNYIYFASPNTLYDATGEQRTDLLNFYSCRLDGANINLLYSAKEYSNGKYIFLYDSGYVYLAIYNGSDIITVKILNNKAISNKTVVNGVTSAFVPSVNSVATTNVSLSTNDKYVYYTRSLDEDEEDETNGNVMAKVNIIDGIETIIRKDNTYTYVLTAYKNNAIYFTRTHFQYSFSTTNQFYLSLNSSTILSDDPTQITSTSYTTVLYVDDVNDNKRGVVAYDGTRVLYIENINEPIHTMYVGSATLLDTIGDYVYCIIDSKLARLNITDQSIVYLSDSELTTISTTPSKYFSIDKNTSQLYFYQTITGDVSTDIGYYLSRVNINSDSANVQFVGKMLAKHIVTPEEEE